jgi:tripartite-type tricarboxylate transporter receptor subunit TctC
VVRFRTAATQIAVVAGLAAFATIAAAQQDFPNRPIRIIVP